MTTKLELQQINARLAADNLALREELSVLRTDFVGCSEERDDLDRQLDNKCASEKKFYEETLHLKAMLNDADIRARRLISAGNRVKSGATSPRRAQMEAARILAMKSGVTTLAGDNNV